MRSVFLSLMLACTVTPTAMAQVRQTRTGAANEEYYRRRAGFLAPPVSPVNDPRPVDAAETRREAGEASRRYEREREGLETSYRRLMELFKQDPPSNRFDAELKEASQNQELLRFVTLLRESGEIALTNDAAFQASIKRFQGVTADAARKFENAAANYQSLADAAEFEQTRVTYQRAANWYRVRAAKAKQEAATRVPTTYEKEHRRFAEFQQSVRAIEEQLKVDPAFMKDDGDGIELLAMFKEYYEKLGAVLQQCTDQILKGMPKEEPKPGKSS